MKHQVQIICNDEKLNRLIRLVLDGAGYELTSKPEHPCPLVLDIDSAELVHNKKHSATIAITRDPQAINSHLAAKLRHIIQRPFEFGELIAAVDESVHNAGKQTYAPHTKKMPALTLCVDTRELRCGQKQVILTPTEATIFSLLTEQRGKTVTYEQLRSILGASASNKTEVHICELRRKIAEIYELPLIKTVRSQGYRID